MSLAFIDPEINAFEFHDLDKDMSNIPDGSTGKSKLPETDDKSVSTSKDSATLTEEPTATKSSRHSKYNEKLKSSSDGKSAASGGEWGLRPPPGFRKPSPPNSPPRG